MEPAFALDLFSAHIPLWEETLSALKGKPEVHALEVGSFEGRSACWLLQNILTHPTSKLTCVDIFEVCEELLESSDRLSLNIDPAFDISGAFDRNIKAIGASGKVQKLKGESETILKELPSASFDLMYIDGSHRAPTVLTDIVLGWGLLKENGLLILDDYRWTCFADQPLKQPRVAIDAFLEIFRNEYDLIHKDYQIVVRKRPKTSSSLS